MQFRFTVFVDNEKPNVICVDDWSIETDVGRPTARVRWEDPIVTDNSGKVFVTCDRQSGTEFNIGLTLVNCEAVDGTANTAGCSFHVNVTGKFYVSLYFLMRVIEYTKYCIEMVLIKMMHVSNLASPFDKLLH